MNNSLIENKVLNYNNFNNVSNKMKFDDYVYDKYNIIHQKLYDDALNKLIDERNYNRDDYRFIEIKQNEYYQPSLVYVQSIYPPFTTEKISLEKYWDPYEFKDIYQDYEMGLEDTRECLSSKKTTADVIYNIENICTELEHDDDKSIQDLYKRGSSILSSLYAYYKNLEEDISL